jgi:Fic family protein
MSKRQRAIELVLEILGLSAQVEQKESELDKLLGVGSPSRNAGEATADAPDSFRARILQFMKENRGRSVTAADVSGAIGCSDHVFRYHMAVLLEEKVVKRVKRGHYQLRGKKT